MTIATVPGPRLPLSWAMRVGRGVLPLALTREGQGPQERPQMIVVLAWSEPVELVPLCHQANGMTALNETLC